jgi:hypothetical protein
MLVFQVLNLKDISNPKICISFLFSHPACISSLSQRRGRQYPNRRPMHTVFCRENLKERKHLNYIKAYLNI